MRCHLQLSCLTSLRVIHRMAVTLAAVVGIASLSVSAQTTVQIHDIMVAGTNPVVGTAATKTLPYSPYYGQSVSVSGIVVGVMSTGDFAGTVYISEPSSSWDSVVLTAEGLPVFGLNSLNSACAVVGATVTVVGQVVLSNSVVAADITAAGTPGTGLLPTSCTVTSTGGTMTQSISVGSVLTEFGDALKYTGMTTTATFYAVAPATGTLVESTETETSTGQFWTTLSSNTATNNHLFRSAGIAGDEYVPSTAPTTVTTWDGNPQRVLIDTTTFGGSPVNITVGQSISCTTGSNIKVGATAGIGLIDYTLGYARLLIFPTSVCTVNGTVATTTSAAADSTHFHVGTLDLNRFYSTTGATIGSVAVSSTAYATRISKAAQAIVNSLGKPDILSVQEVQDLPSLTDLATAVNTLGSVTYVPYLVQGNDPNSLNLGFLVNSTTLVTDSVTQVEKSSTYTTTSGSSATLWERPPLVLNAEFVRLGKNYPVTVINVHLTPRTNIDDTTLGPDIRQHRAAQAADLSALVQTYQTAGDNVIVAGNLNAFEYSDGYVDVTGIIDGSPATASNVTLSQATSTTGALTDLVTSVPATSRYNYIERGDAVVYEHILASATVTNNATASASLASYVSAVTQPHFTTDFAAINANSATTPAGLTPHDGFVVAFLIPPVPTTAALSASILNFGDVDLGASSSLTISVTNTTTFASTVNVTKIAISGTNAADFSQTSNCTSLAEAESCTITVTFAPTATGTRTALLTVTNDSTSDPTLTATLTGDGIDTTATLTPASATFPSTDIGANSASQTFTFTNTSLIAETVSSATVTGDYSIATNTCASVSIPAAGTCSIAVVFSPTAAGTRTGTLTVLDSSTGNPTLTASLSGTGLNTTATLTPATQDFGSVYAGGGLSAAKVFNVTNTSAISITIKSIALTGNFTETSTCGTTLAAGASCTISVVFAPMTTGTLTGTLIVTNSSTANPTLTATLTGTGLPTTATLTPLTATYVNTIVGNTSAAKTFLWTNTSAVPLTISKVSTTGDFTVSSTTCSGIIAANSSCAVLVTFTPTVLGARTGTVSVTSTSSANGTLTATLSGRGVADVEASVVSLNFGNVDVGSTSASQTVTITNYTGASIALTSIQISGDYADTTTCGSTLAGLGTCTITVVFKPTTTGVLAGTIIVNTNDTKYPVITIALTGNGVDFGIAISPTSGSTVAGYSVSPNITLTPIGGFSAPITMTCSTTATGSTCIPQSATVTVSATTTLPLAITTTSQYTVIGYGGFGSMGHPWLTLFSFLSAFAILVRLRKTRVAPRLLAGIVMLMLLAGANLGCGSRDPDKNSSPTYPGTYTYTVSATDGTITHTATYSLTVTVRD